MPRNGAPRRIRLEGIWLPLVTPFRDGVLDEAALAGLARHYADQPIDGLVLAATTGEALTLEPEETERLVAVAAAAVGDRLPILLGLSGSGTGRLVKTLARTAAWPIDGYLIACPYYTRPSQEGLRRHFALLAERSDKPIVVYNIPYRTGVNMTNETLLGLAGLDRIIGVKDCCADPAQTFDLMRDRPPGFSVMTGEDSQFFSALAHGADGGILASAHVDPESFAEIRHLLLAGDRPRAVLLWAELVDTVRLLFAEPNPAPIKHWLWREGLLPSPEVRLPLTGVSDALARRIAAAVDRRTRCAAVTE
jgi:4-hydroxy-tetrahydrodipicolinate synthase